MGFKADLLNQYRKAVKAGSYIGTFNEYTGGRFTDKGGATEARLTRQAIAEASVDLDAQIRAAGGDPTRFSLQEKRALNINAMAANFARQQATVTAGQSLQDVATQVGATPESIIASNPMMFPRSGDGIDTTVFAGQSLNVPEPGSLAARVAAANKILAGQRPSGPVVGRGSRASRAATQATRGAPVAGRGSRAARTSTQAAQRTLTARVAAANRQLVAQRRATLTPTPIDFSGLAGVPAPRFSVPTSIEAAQRSVSTTLKAATKSFTNKNGRLSQAQIDSINKNITSSTTGTMEEIMSRNAGNPDFQMDAMINAFASPSFINTINALGSGIPPTYIDQKAFNALKQMYPDAASALERDYELRPLATGKGARAYWYTGSQDPGDTTAGSGAGGTGSGGTGGSGRSIKSIIRGAVPQPGAPRGTGSTSSGFTPTGRSILWRI